MLCGSDPHYLVLTINLVISGFSARPTIGTIRENTNIGGYSLHSTHKAQTQTRLTLESLDKIPTLESTVYTVNTRTQTQINGTIREHTNIGVYSLHSTHTQTQTRLLIRNKYNRWVYSLHSIQTNTRINETIREKTINVFTVYIVQTLKHNHAYQCNF